MATLFGVYCCWFGWQCSLDCRTHSALQLYKYFVIHRVVHASSVWRYWFLRSHLQRGVTLQKQATNLSQDNMVPQHIEQATLFRVPHYPSPINNSFECVTIKWRLRVQQNVFVFSMAAFTFTMTTSKHIAANENLTNLTSSCCPRWSSMFCFSSENTDTILVSFDVVCCVLSHR